jgi:hypothetical protein
LLFDHYLGPNNVRNMANAADTKLSNTLYNGEKKRFIWETYVRIHTEQHYVLNGLKEYGYSGIDDSSKVRHLLKGIKTTELDVCKAQVMASPTLRDDLPATVELYSTFIKQMKAENPQLNISEVTYARQSGGGKGGGKRGSSGISNNSNGDVADRLFEKHEYHTLTPEQKNNLHLKRFKQGHVGTGKNSRDGKSHAKCSQSSNIKQIQRTIYALSSRFDKLGVPNDDEDECASEEETESPHRSNSALTHQTKNKGKTGN